MKRSIVTWVVLLSCGCFMGCTATKPAAAPAAAPTAPILYCVRVETPPMIDGRLGDLAWQQAPAAPLTFTSKRKRLPKSVGEARFVCDADWFYAAVRVEDQDLFNHYANRDDPLWYEDVIELFIQPDSESRPYFEFQFSPASQVFDAWYPSRSVATRSLRYALLWNSSIEYRIGLDGTLNAWKDADRGYCVELRIPMYELKAHGSSDTWRIMASMYDYSAYLDDRLDAETAPVENMHNFEAWNTLVFTESADAR